jgi:hypothetical protein
MKKTLTILILIIFSCKNDKIDNKEEVKYSNSTESKTKKMIEMFEKSNKSQNKIILGVWAIDSFEENSKIQIRYLNSDSSFSAFDFKPDNKLYHAKKVDIGVQVNLFSDFIVINDSVYLYREKENLVQAYSFQIIDKKKLVLTNGDPIGFENFLKSKTYFSRIPNYNSESRIKKIIEEREKLKK